MTQLDVQIMGQSYRLACPEGAQARLLEVASQVDAAMCKIRAAGKVKARERIAVLAALNLAFDLGRNPACDAEPSANADGTAETASANVDDPRLTALLQRLNTALSEDGCLL